MKPAQKLTSGGNLKAQASTRLNRDNQFKADTVQRRGVLPQQVVKRPAAPPVYRPQTLPRVLQTKTATTRQPQVPNQERKPMAPPGLRPHSAPKTLQSKAAGGQPQPLTQRQAGVQRVRQPEQQTIQPRIGPTRQVEKNVPARSSPLSSKTQGAVQRSRSHISNSRSVIQRMIWRIDAPTDDERNRAITGAVESTLSTRKGGAKGLGLRGRVISDKRNLGDIGRDETLYILAHGNGLKVGGMVDTDLAAILSVWLPDNYRGKIKLIACLSASVSAPILAPQTNSYAKWVSHLLNYLGRPNLTVQGMDGVADVDDQGRIIVYDTATYLKWMRDPKGDLDYVSGKGAGAKLRFRNMEPVEGGPPHQERGLGVGARTFKGWK